MRYIILLSSLGLSFGLNACKINGFSEGSPNKFSGGAFLGKGSSNVTDGTKGQGEGKNGEGNGNGKGEGEGEGNGEGVGTNDPDGGVIDIPQKPEVPGDVTGGKVVTKEPTDSDKKIISNCAKALGIELPLNQGQVRTIVANVNVLSTGAVMSDKRVTEQPELTLVMASVNVLGAVRWELMNPQGLYCIVTNVNVLAKLTVEISKTAKLAEGVLGVNVLSAANQKTSGVGVNVLSNVQVIQK